MAPGPRPITRAASSVPNLLEIWALYQDNSNNNLFKREWDWITAGEVQTPTPVSQRYKHTTTWAKQARFFFVSTDRSKVNFLPANQTRKLFKMGGTWITRNKVATVMVRGTTEMVNYC